MAVDPVCFSAAYDAQKVDRFQRLMEHAHHLLFLDGQKCIDPDAIEVSHVKNVAQFDSPSMAQRTLKFILNFSHSVWWFASGCDEGELKPQTFIKSSQRNPQDSGEKSRMDF